MAMFKMQICLVRKAMWFGMFMPRVMSFVQYFTDSHSLYSFVISLFVICALGLSTVSTCDLHL